MEVSEEELVKLDDLASGAAPGEWCPDWTYSAIRHVQRNCDIECSKHGDDAGEDDDCLSFGRYDGPYVAYANPDRIRRLIADLREARKPPAEVTALSLGKFGHHPDPLVDSHVEVDRLQGYLLTVMTALTDVLSLDVASPNGQRVKTNVRWAIGEITGDEKMKIVAPNQVPPAEVQP